MDEVYERVVVGVMQEWGLYLGDGRDEWMDG